MGGRQLSCLCPAKKPTAQRLGRSAYYPDIAFRNIVQKLLFSRKSPL